MGAFTMCVVRRRCLLQESAHTSLSTRCSTIIQERKKQFNKCIYCHVFTRHQTITATGLTVKCHIGNCKNRFHVTCGYAHGSCLFDHADWPDLITIMCHEHANRLKSDLCDKKRVVPFKIGTQVSVVKENDFKIVNFEEQMFYEVDFGDGTFSNDMLPEDFIVTFFNTT